MRPSFPVVCRSLSCTLLLCICFAEMPLGSVVTGVRIGSHPNSARIVFDADGPIEVDQPLVDPNGAVLVAFPGADLAALSAHVLGPEFGIQAVEFIQWKSVLVARVTARPPVHRVDTFALPSPHRIVLDLYWSPERELVPPGVVLPGNSGSNLTQSAAAALGHLSQKGGTEAGLEPAARAGETHAGFPGVLKDLASADGRLSIFLVALLGFLSGAFLAVLLIGWHRDRSATIPRRRADDEGLMWEQRLADINWRIETELARYENLSGAQSER